MNITRIVISLDTQDSSNVGWAYWVYDDNDLDSSGPLGKRGHRARTLTSLRRQLARESSQPLASLLRKIGDAGFKASQEYTGWYWNKE